MKIKFLKTIFLLALGTSVVTSCVGEDDFSGGYFICGVAPKRLLCCVCFNGWALIKVSFLSDVAYVSCILFSQIKDIVFVLNLYRILMLNLNSYKF